jgi:hypothetical protein
MPLQVCARWQGDCQPIWGRGLLSRAG